MDLTPDIFFHQNIFPSVFRASLAGLTVVHSDILFAALDLFRAIVMHNCLRPDAEGPEHTQWATVIRGVIREQGFDLTGYLLSGMIGEFPEDAIANVVSIFRVLTTMFPQEMLQWLPNVLQQLPAVSAPNQAKNQFLLDLTTCVVSRLSCIQLIDVLFSAVNERNYDRVKHSILTFNRASRKARDRRRMGA